MKCTCGNELEFETSGSGSDSILKPCACCLNDKFQDGYAVGLEEGRERGYADFAEYEEINGIE